MASLVNAVELLQNIGFYNVVFPFLLIMALMYGILKKLKFFESEAVNIIIAALIGLFIVSASNTVEFISNLLPAIIALIVVVTLVMLIFSFMGVPQESFKQMLSTPMGSGIMIVLILIIVFAAIGATFSGSLTRIYGDDTGTTTTTNGTNATTGGLGTKTIQTIFDPTIMGLIVMILVFSAATYFITRPTAVKK